jgi:hypothetical protein
MTAPFTDLQLSEHASLVVATLRDAMTAMAHFGSSEESMTRLAHMLVVAERAAADEFRRDERDRHGASS